MLANIRRIAKGCQRGCVHTSPFPARMARTKGHSSLIQARTGCKSPVNTPGRQRIVAHQFKAAVAAHFSLEVCQDQVYNSRRIDVGDPGTYFIIHTGILLRRCSMFESLSERIEKDERGTVNKNQRLLFWLAVFLFVFVGSYFGVRLFG